MKLDFALGSPATLSALPAIHPRVSGETERLLDVLVCPPDHLAPVPCCAVTCNSLRNGFEVNPPAAVSQHLALRQALQDHGVRCHQMEAAPGLPDSCFTRDVGVATPWGMVALNPALAHRQAEVDHFLRWARRVSYAPVNQVRNGRIEGGDVCIARPGLLIVGISGSRTDEAGAEEFSAPFRARGWEVLTCRFDPHFLHLDTIFCMLDDSRALACPEALEPRFVERLGELGIELLGVSYRDSQRLGCNVVSVDGRTILAGTATPDVTALMRRHGFDVVELDLDQLNACGGGVHCLTMPLRRSSAASLRS